ncbi:MAG: methionyl-tRNA formyltransferase [Alphaproteobacteria bacterium]|nr:methionyl-tRNA formyltransferase [Alphaproteobacteria bacterium]
MGTPGFAVPALKTLIAAGHDIVCVYSQPPRRAGRGQKARPSPVQAFADDKGIPVRTPKSLRDPEEQAAFAALDADAAVVAAYGLILPPAILEAPRFGCLNIHASLLPRWRGAAPIQRAILAGDTQSGVTIMQMDEGLDTGGVLLSEAVPITMETTASNLHDALAARGGPLVVEALDGLAAGTLKATPQPETGVTYAEKLSRDEGRLDWTRPAPYLARAVRAFTPWPGAWFEHDGARIKILEACVESGSATPGTIIDDRLTIACSEGALRLLTVQRSGRAAVDAESFLRGYDLPAGTVLP